MRHKNKHIGFFAVLFFFISGIGRKEEGPFPTYTQMVVGGEVWQGTPTAKPKKKGEGGLYFCLLSERQLESTCVGGWTGTGRAFITSPACEFA